MHVLRHFEERNEATADSDVTTDRYEVGYYAPDGTWVCVLKYEAPGDEYAFVRACAEVNYLNGGTGERRYE